MIDHVVFVPGICGSELWDGNDLVWPGTGWEKLISGYPDSLADKLASADLQVGKILDRVSLFGGTIDHFATGYDVALDLLASLGFSGANLTPFPYDWRQDIRVSARLLHQTLTTDLAGKHVAIVAHSMGGLVSRYAIENLGKPPNVELLVLAAVPHLGAPAAFQTLIGARPETFLSPAQCKRISANPKFPAAYQLLPHPNTATFQQIDAAGFHTVDIYDANVYRPLGLAPASMDIARQTWTELAPLALGAPTPCRYFAVAGCEGSTIISNAVSLGATGSVGVESQVAGDGTVPLWSGAPAALPCRFVPSDHLGVFKDGHMRTILQGLLHPAATVHPFSLGADPGHLTALPDGLRRLQAAPQPRLAVQASARSVLPGAELIASIVLLDTPMSVLTGELLISLVTPEGTTDLPPQTVNYTGAPIRKLDVVVTPNRPGLLVLDFRGPGWADDPQRSATVLVLPTD